MACPQIYNPTDADSISLGETQAIFGGGSSPAGYYFDTISCFGYTLTKARVKVGTSPSTYTITGSATDFINLPDGQYPPYYGNTNVTITGLTGSTLYYYMLQVSDDNGATWDDSVSGEGQFTTGSSDPGAPVADFTVANTTTAGQVPFYVQFQDLSSSTTNTAISWEWDYGDGGTLYTQSQNPLHTYITAGTYTVTLTAGNAGGTDSEVKASFLVLVAGAPVATFTGDTTTGQRPLSVQFTDNSTNNPNAWAWAFGDGTVSTSQNPSKTYDAAGTYTVTLTVSNVLASHSASRTSYINVTPIPVAATFAGIPLTGDAPLSVQFTGTPTGDSTSVSWNFGDTVTAVSANPQHTYYTTGTFTVSYIVYGTTGAGTSTATRASYITVQKDTTYRALLDEIRRSLLMNVDQVAVCDDFVEFGGAANVLRYVYNRICRLQLETGILRKTSTTISAAATGVLTLPSDLIEIRDVYANGYRLNPVDPRMADLADGDWETVGSGDYLGWYMKPGDSLNIHLVPAITPDTFSLNYVYAPTAPTVPSPCTNAFEVVPIPFVFRWIVKYGVLADLLSNEGEMYDMPRAELCERMFAEGVEFVKLALKGD